MKVERIPWLATSLAVAATAALIALVAFGAPDFAMARLAQLTGMSRLLPPAANGVVRVQSSRWAQNPDVLPEESRHPLPEASGVARLRELRQRPPLLIETATLVAPAETGTLRIFAPSLTLRDVSLTTNGASLEIETETLDVTNSTIRAFPADAAGKIGRGGGRVRIVVHGRMRGVLGIDLSGRPGKSGGAGAPGLPGVAGGRGEKARSGPTVCLAPAGRGGDGSPGGSGAAGENGADGGDGGSLDVIAADPVGIAGQMQFIANGGAAGSGGPGGQGGPGGAGGAGGDPAGVCFGNGPAGQAGARGPAGRAGEAGRTGAEGELHVNDLGSG